MIRYANTHMGNGISISTVEYSREGYTRWTLFHDVSVLAWGNCPDVADAHGHAVRAAMDIIGVDTRSDVVEALKSALGIQDGD